MNNSLGCDPYTKKSTNSETYDSNLYECNILTTPGFIFGAKTIRDIEEEKMDKIKAGI